MTQAKNPLSKVVILILIALILGLGGWWVYQNDNKNGAKTNQTADPYAGWLTYDEERLSLKHPASWKVQQSDPNVGWIHLEGPSDSGIGINNTGEDNNPATNKRIYLAISPDTQTEREDGQVYDVISLDLSQSPNAKLVISDLDAQGHAQIIEVTDDESVKAGDNTYKLTALVGNKRVRIFANVMYDKQTSFGWILDVPSFKDTQSFKDLVKIINSIQIK